MRKNNVLLGAALVGGFLLFKHKPVIAEEEQKEDKIKVGIFADHVIGESPLTINFRLDTQGKRPLKIVNWSFGDGETSSLVNPSHTFYTVLETEVFYVDVSAIDATDAKGSGRLNITVVKENGNGNEVTGNGNGNGEITVKEVTVENVLSSSPVWSGTTPNIWMPEVAKKLGTSQSNAIALLGNTSGVPYFGEYDEALHGLKVITKKYNLPVHDYDF